MSPIYFLSLGVLSLALSACGGNSGSSKPIKEDATSDAGTASSLQNSGTASSAVSSEATSEMPVVSSVSSMALSSLASSSEANPEGEQPPSSQAMSSSSSAPVFGVEKSFPAKNQRYILPASVLSVTLSKDIDSASVDTNSAIILSERDTAVAVSGTVAIADARTLTFTPAEPLKENLIYNIALSGDILAQDGDSYPGGNWDFSTPPNLGVTTQAHIAQCGNSSTVEGLAFVVRERMLQEGSVCKSLGFTLPVGGYTTRLNCKLVDVANDAVAFKVRSFRTNVRQGNNAFDASFDYDSAVMLRGYNQAYKNLNLSSLNGSKKYANYFADLDHAKCDVIMNPKFTEFGSRLLSVSGFPSVNIFTFHEYMLGEAE
ncbi:Ig-like domain-containing protein [Marinagarivorans algicola]|uniref:Ig-like domain-containing protein n=1 Tax=Marinagarivorans algicola TaxID=1513270 RepID=UPI000A6201A2|nr:Ig-like domain-containing protein [Marinagarivorans algicola]